MYNKTVTPVYCKTSDSISTYSGRKLTNKKIQTEIFYPESDGKPMAENTIHYELIVKIKENLEILFADDSNVFIAGDLFWYPVEGDNKIKYAPDVMVAIGRPKGQRGSYLQWKEKNIAPQVIFEIRSPNNSTREMNKKFKFYELYDVKEYYLFNHTSNKLDAWVRYKNKLKQLSETEISNWTSPELNISFEVTDTLNLYYPNGRKFKSMIELERERKNEKLRSEKEKKKAEKEKLRAEKEKLRAEKEKLKAEKEKLKAEKEKNRAEAEKKKAEKEKKKAEKEKLRAEKLEAELKELRLKLDQIAK